MLNPHFVSEDCNITASITIYAVHVLLRSLSTQYTFCFDHYLRSTRYKDNIIITEYQTCH